MKLVTVLAAAAAIALGAGSAAAEPAGPMCTPHFKTEKHIVYYSYPPIAQVLVYRVDRQCRRELVRSYLERHHYGMRD